MAPGGVFFERFPWNWRRFGCECHRYPLAFAAQERLQEFRHQAVQAVAGLVAKPAGKAQRPATEVLAEKCRLGIAAQGQFFRRVAVRQGIGFLDAQKLHELQFHADVVQAIIEIRREVDPKGPIEPGDVGQALRFFENMRLPVLGFVGRAFLGNGVPEALEVRCPQ